MMRLGMRRLAPGVLAALVALAVVLRIGVVLNRRIDPDESQHLHVAWLITQGQVPYRDFWEHHLPFFHYAMAPLTAWLAERPEVYFAARSMMTLLAAAAVVLTWRLARRLSVDGAVWAAVVLLFLPQFAETSTETRPDVPALVAHLATLLALVRWRENGRTGWLWVAGAWQGAALALSIKAIFGLAGVMVVVAGLPRRGGDPARRAAPDPSTRLLAGMARVLVVLIAVLVAFTGIATLGGLYRDVVLDSLRFVDFGKDVASLRERGGRVPGRGPRARARPPRAGPRHPGDTPCMVTGSWRASTGVSALFLPRTPAVYQHAWLPLLPVVADLCGTDSRHAG